MILGGIDKTVIIWYVIVPGTESIINIKLQLMDVS